MKNFCFILFLVTAYMNNTYSQAGCHRDVFIRIKSIEPTGNPVWRTGNFGCTQDEPFFNDIWKSSNFYDPFKLVRGTAYNKSLSGKGPEYFWLKGGCCGNTVCIDDNSTSAISTARIRLSNVNTCYNTSVWLNFCSQCEDCNNDHLEHKGRWWKYEQPFRPNDLNIYGSSNPLPIDIKYQMLVSCIWSLGKNYGCGPDEFN